MYNEIFDHLEKRTFFFFVFFFNPRRIMLTIKQKYLAVNSFSCLHTYKVSNSRVLTLRLIQGKKKWLLYYPFNTILRPFDTDTYF